MKNSFLELMFVGTFLCTGAIAVSPTSAEDLWGDELIADSKRWVSSHVIYILHLLKTRLTLHLLLMHTANQIKGL